VNREIYARRGKFDFGFEEHLLRGLKALFPEKSLFGGEGSSQKQTKKFIL
jgi:hypothetical protein